MKGMSQDVVYLDKELDHPFSKLSETFKESDLPTVGDPYPHTLVKISKERRR